MVVITLWSLWTAAIAVTLDAAPIPVETFLCDGRPDLQLFIRGKEVAFMLRQQHRMVHVLGACVTRCGIFFPVPRRADLAGFRVWSRPTRYGIRTLLGAPCGGPPLAPSPAIGPLRACPEPAKPRFAGSA